MNETVAEQLALLPQYLGRHLLLTTVAMATGIIVCLPLGAAITRVRSLQWPVLTIAGILQTIPGIALLALMVPLLGTIGFVPAIIALILYSFLPILRNTVTGILGVDDAIKEAARGIGMTDTQMLFRIELPLALPVIIAGIRTATVWVVGTATLATPVGATSLGNYIFSGLQTQNITAVLIGCIAAASLAIIIDQIIRLVEIAAEKRNRILGIISGSLVVFLFGLGLSPVIAGSFSSQRDTTIVVGAKTFTEQYILAEVIADALAEGGFITDKREGMGSIILFEALANNSVDCYVDYSGTIWANAMKRDEIPDRLIVLDTMSAWLKRERNIYCLGTLGFENAYALALRRPMAESLRVSTIDDLAAIAHTLTIGSDYEFFSRPEWRKLQNTYNLTFKKMLTVDPTLMYSAVAGGQCDVITAFSTDGRIIAYDLIVLEDTRQAFPPYDAVLLLSPEAAERPALRQHLRKLLESITNEQMRQANKMVDLDKLPIDSAAAFLSPAR